MKKAPQSKWVTGVLAFLFAFLLFFYANSQNGLINSTNSSQIYYDEMLYNVPVQLNYDKDKYFVSGYEEAVNVQLSSANRIQLGLEANEDTRSFQIVADLNNSELGTFEVKLRAVSLSSAVTATIEPETITVTVEKKVTQSFDVEVPIPEQIIDEGYTIEASSIQPKTVKITTGEETLKAIDKVIAPITDVAQSADLLQQVVNVQAVDSKGQVLRIEHPEPQVEVSLSLGLPTKKVMLQMHPTGTRPTNISHYTFSFSPQTVEIKGPSLIIDTITTIEVPIAITNIHEKTKQKVKIPVTNQYLVEPAEIEVEITPVYIENNSKERERPLKLKTQQVRIVQNKHKRAD